MSVDPVAGPARFARSPAEHAAPAVMMSRVTLAVRARIQVAVPTGVVHAFRPAGRRWSPAARAGGADGLAAGPD
jgi:hypothetical protein